jgi:tetratricopeptide (TPR) repeat protein
MKKGVGSILQAAACWAGLAVCGVALATPPQFRFEAQPGPYAVGLKVVEQYDHSRVYRHSTDELGRPYDGERARPLQTLVWYPAERSKAKAMTLHDYVNLWATETDFGEPRMPYRAKVWRSAMSASLAQTLRAVRDAPVASGHFRAVIYAPGSSGPSWDNADLCEYLASFGYVVIASPSLGTADRSMTNDLVGANTEASDITYLIQYAQTLQNVESTGVAVIGTSWGGMAGLYAAARDSRISALVALDGSMRYFPGLFNPAGEVHPERMSIPFMFVMQGDYSLELRERYGDPNLRDGLGVLSTWTHGDLIVAHMLCMAHASLSSMWQRNEDYWREYGKSALLQPGDYDREDAIRGYAWMARYTLKFLDAYLKHDAEAMEFLTASPQANGVPRHYVAVSYRRAAPVALSLEDFRSETGRRGFERAAEVYEAFRKEEPGFRLDERSLGDWADELINVDHLSEAIALLKLNVQTHPDSSNAYGSLAEAYGLSGQKQSAVSTYQQALARDPGNEVARRKLEDLLANPVEVSRNDPQRQPAPSLALK